MWRKTGSRCVSVKNGYCSCWCNSKKLKIKSPTMVRFTLSCKIIDERMTLDNE